MSIFTLASPFNSPFSSGGSGTTADVPGRFHIALGGRGYMLDLATDNNGFRGTHFSRKSTAILRNQADTANSPGEQSLNRDSTWRRAVESWHHGAGQTYFDRADSASDAARFNTSKGVNVWTKWQMSLLNDTSNQLVSANTNLRLAASGTFTYVADGNSLRYTADITANPVVWTTVTGTPASACQFVTSDGFTVYASYGASGIYSTARGTATAASFNVTASTILGYVKGRLMSANGNALYNITSGAAQTLILTHPNTDFSWVGFAEGPGFIYAAGYSGNRSLIYKITIQADGTALSAPIVAGELPTGETVRTIKGYLGTLSIGTDLGVRFATISAAGDLTIGALIKTTSPVFNFEPADAYIWYAMSNYDATSTGLGRLSPGVFTDTLVPAYASDLMASAQGAVLSISTQGSRRCFTVSGVGVFVESASKVPSGNLTSGKVTFGIGDPKVAMFLDLRHTPLAGSISVALSTDGGTPVTSGTSNSAGSTQPVYPINLAQSRGETFETTLTLTRDTVITAGPTITRATLRAFPAPTRSFTMVAPILMHSVVQDVNGNDVYCDVEAERVFLEGLMTAELLVTFQQGSATYSVLVDDITEVPIKPSRDRTGFDGTLVLFLKDVT